MQQATCTASKANAQLLRDRRNHILSVKYAKHDGGCQWPKAALHLGLRINVLSKCTRQLSKASPSLLHRLPLCSGSSAPLHGASTSILEQSSLPKRGC